MAEKAVILDPHVKVGIVAGDGGTTILPMALSPALAKQYLLTGDPLTAEDALRMRLVKTSFPRPRNWKPTRSPLPDDWRFVIRT